MDNLWIIYNVWLKIMVITVLTTDCSCLAASSSWFFFRILSHSHLTSSVQWQTGPPWWVPFFMVLRWRWFKRCPCERHQLPNLCWSKPHSFFRFIPRTSHIAPRCTIELVVPKTKELILGDESHNEKQPDIPGTARAPGRVLLTSL